MLWTERDTVCPTRAYPRYVSWYHHPVCTSVHPVPSPGPASILATHISSVLSLLWLCALVPSGSFPAAGVPEASCENLPQLLACVTKAHLGTWEQEVFSSIPKERGRVHCAVASDLCREMQSAGLLLCPNFCLPWQAKAQSTGAA